MIFFPFGDHFSRCSSSPTLGIIHTRCSSCIFVNVQFLTRRNRKWRSIERLCSPSICKCKCKCKCKWKFNVRRCRMYRIFSSVFWLLNSKIYIVDRLCQSLLCCTLFFLQNRTTIVDGCKYMFVGKRLKVPLHWMFYALVVAYPLLSLSNFLKPILILCRVDLFLYGTERMICQIKRQGWMVGIWDWIFFMAEHVNMWVSHNLLGLVSCCMYSCSYRKIIKMQSRLSHSFVVCSNAQCAVCAVWVPRNRTSWDIS